MNCISKAKQSITKMSTDYDKVLTFLKGQGYVPTLRIAKEVFKNEKTPTCAMVNPLLYDMQREGLIEKRTKKANGGKPEWRLIEQNEDDDEV
jgi:hypothetical protein